MKYATFKPDGSLNLRLIAGLHVIPEGAVQVSDELWGRLLDEPARFFLSESGAIEERSVPVAVPDSTFIERGWRDAELAAVVWLRDRHRDQVEIGAITTLSSEQFLELLRYMQALRDWPQSDTFPDAAERPQAPPWIADQTQ